jgi:hypothetical protein
METREEIIKKLHEQTAYLRSVFGVLKIGLFGSFAAGNPRQDSDIDIIVEFDRPIGMKFMDFADYLQNLFNRPVDVLTPAGIEGIRNSKIVEEIRRSIVYV